MGKTTSNYKNLRINLEDIAGIINAWGIGSSYCNVCVEAPKDMGAQTLNYFVDCDGKVATIAVFPAKGGVCTISPKVGKEQTISTEIAEFIVSHSGKLADSNPYKNGLSIEVPQDEFDAFFELMKEQEDVVVDEERTETYKFFARLRNERYKDSIVVSYYTSGKLVIQGKPLELFSTAVEILSNEHGLLQVVNAETKSAGLSINGNDLLEDMKESLGEVYNFLSTTQKAMLASAYVFYRTNIVVVEGGIDMDYSVLFHPASRALEGYIFRLLVNNNVLHENEEHLGYYFRKEDEEGPLTLYDQYKDAIDNDIVADEINRLYKLYHRLRHPYSHATENDYTTSIILDRKKADYYFKEIIETFNKSYEAILLAKK